MPVLIVLGSIGLVALALIYWALIFCARESGAAGKMLAVALGAVITGLAIGAAPIYLLMPASIGCPPDSPC